MTSDLMSEIEKILQRSPSRIIEGRDPYLLAAKRMTRLTEKTGSSAAVAELNSTATY